ncbi:MAG: Trk system potassium transporter TrkA, partial [Candidatus Spyradocola sp.]
MRILVVGDGKVGHTIAEHLTREKHDVVIIDQDDEVLTKCEDTLDVICVRGNGANAKVLLDAQADRADILIATTASDETNMLCGLIAKRLGTKYIIARIRDPEYNDSLTLLQRELGIDMALNPERATALEISRLLRFPFANNIESFAKGRVEMVEFRAQEHDVVTGHALKDLARMRGLPQVLYAVIERDGRVIIPTGDFIIQAGDRVHVAGDMVTITAYFQYLGKNSLRIRRVMLLGGGRISYYLAKMLVPMGIRVSMIEINERKANHLSELLPEVNVIYGDGTDQELLDQEGLK